MTKFQIILPSKDAGAPPTEPMRLKRGKPRDKTSPFGPYLLTQELATTINVALALNQPLLVTGEPGCGKTSLAWAIAAQLGTKVLEFYTKSTSVGRDLLYQFDALRRFRDATEGKDDVDNMNNYIDYCALGEAILSDQTCVVLIDEIDKASRDLPNDLLHELDQMEFKVPEFGRDAKPNTAKVKHFVLITSNSEHRLPAQFLRRCVYAHLGFPDAGMLTEIVKMHCDPPSPGFFELCVRRFLELREVDDLLKPPATGELLAWVQALERMGVTESELKATTTRALPALEVLLKMFDDLRLVRGG